MFEGKKIDVEGLVRAKSTQPGATQEAAAPYGDKGGTKGGTGPKKAERDGRGQGAGRPACRAWSPKEITGETEGVLVLERPPG